MGAVLELDIRAAQSSAHVSGTINVALDRTIHAFTASPKLLMSRRNESTSRLDHPTTRLWASTLAKRRGANRLRAKRTDLAQAGRKEATITNDSAEDDDDNLGQNVRMLALPKRSAATAATIRLLAL